MSLILYSHPRSGSTFIIRILADLLSKQIGKPVKLYNELFNTMDPSTMGNVADLHLDIRNWNKDIDVVELINNELTHVQRKFGSPNALTEWCYKEFTARKLMLDQLNQQAEGYVLKHFFTNTKINYNSELVKVAHQHSILFYRKDFYQAILSLLIRTYYIDIPSAVNNKAHRHLDGHNWNNEMLPIEARAMTINPKVFAGRMQPFLNFLQFQKDNQISNILTYEDVINDHPFGFDNKIALSEYQGKTNFYPMQYADNKSVYFTNSSDIPNMFETLLIESDLLNTAHELGINFKGD